MAALFPRWSNTGFKLLLGLIVAGALGVPVLLIGYVRTPWVTGVGHEVSQPVEFDHRHHVHDDGIDCRYCHYTVEKASKAGMPPSSLCMNCHGQIWNASPLLAEVRESYFEDRPIRWQRVHAMPDFVFFNHSIHVNKGIGCVSCHGRVDQMPGVRQAEPLTMGWCLDCHRNPQAHVRPREEVTNMAWTPPAGEAGRELQRALAQEYGLQSLTHCSACHR